MTKTDRYVECSAAGMKYRLIPVTDEIIRCMIAKDEVKTEQESLIIEKKEYPQVPFEAAEADEVVTVKTSAVQAELNLKTGGITWKHADGSVWLEQNKADLTRIDVVHYNTGGEKPIINRVKTVDGERNFIQNLKAEKIRDGYRARVFFDWKEDEEIHGLGQAEEGIYNYREHTQYLYQHNMRIPMPMFVSTEGYGVLFDCCSLMTFNDEGRESYLFLDTVDQIDYYFLGGNTMDEIIHDYRYLTGKAQMLPKWAYGYIQSKEQYYTAKELAEIVRHYREIGVPIDCVVQDWNTWEPGNWGEKILDKERYGDNKECIKQEAGSVPLQGAASSSAGASVVSASASSAASSVGTASSPRYLAMISLYSPLSFLSSVIDAPAIIPSACPAWHAAIEASHPRLLSSYSKP